MFHKSHATAVVERSWKRVSVKETWDLLLDSFVYPTPHRLSKSYLILFCKIDPEPAQLRHRSAI